MSENEERTAKERTELYEREMEHEEHRETPLDTAGRDAAETEERGEARREKRGEEKGG